MILKDEQGEVELDFEHLMRWASELSRLSMAVGIGTVIGTNSPSRVTHYANKAIEQTWQNEQWCERIVNLLFEHARGERRKP